MPGATAAAQANVAVEEAGEGIRHDLSFTNRYENDYR